MWIRECSTNRTLINFYNKLSFYNNILQYNILCHLQKKGLQAKKKGKERRIKKNKNTKSKKPKEKIKPEKIGRILSNIHILLSFPSIEFLPSTNIFEKIILDIIFK